MCEIFVYRLDFIVLLLSTVLIIIIIQFVTLKRNGNQAGNESVATLAIYSFLLLQLQFLWFSSNFSNERNCNGNSDKQIVSI